MIADLIRGKAPNGRAPDPRDQLRQAQGIVKRATDAARRADEAAQRARAAHDRTREALAAFGDVDADVARIRAADVRAGGTGGGPLPNDLVVRRARQQRAAEDAGDAERAAAIIEAEAADARAELARVEAELALVVDAVMQAEAAVVVNRMRERERAAAADRLLACSLLVIRTPSDRPLGWELQAITMDLQHGHMMDVAAAARLPSGEPVWRELQKRLRTDANATIGGGGG